MYLEFFKLREMPFTITPDPAYLYLSPRHQEALGHLLYGTGQYGGFVQLTGEVGTGKTTVVRTLLEQKLENVDVAMIHNPRQSELEFVQSICDELGVAYAAETVTLKTLIDALNAHLLRSHAAGRRTVLIIDEAQNLTRDVLEQVRLLTNLETHKEKLLRIMLIGQPELIEQLARPDLRQLASRITARYHLTPLDERETGEYIRHRLRVAGSQEELFPPATVREIHRHTRGVPRLINVLCDRAMLGAYGQGLRRISEEVIARAALESLGADAIAASGRRFRLGIPGIPLVWLEVTLAAFALVLALVLLYQTFFAESAAPTVAVRAPSPAPVASAAATAPPAAVVETAPQTAPPIAPPAEQAPPPPAEAEVSAADLTTLLQSTQPLPLVISHLIRLWNSEIRIPRGQNVCAELKLHALECFKSNGEWGDLRQMKRPAVLSLSTGRGDLQHVLLTGLTDTVATLDSAQGALKVRLEDLDALWTGEFLLLWKRGTLETFIGPGAIGPPVLWLRHRLAEIDGRSAQPPLSTRFDEDLRQQLASFQGREGLDADGVAGVRTLIRLGEGLPGTPTLETKP